VRQLIQSGPQLDVLAIMSLVELLCLPESSAERVVRRLEGKLLSCFHLSKIIMVL
jgi:hypothetical protein